MPDENIKETITSSEVLSAIFNYYGIPRLFIM